MDRRLDRRDLRRLEKGAHGYRSKVFRHVLANYYKLKRRGVGEKEGPTWAEVAEILAGARQTNGRGGPLSAEVTRKLFARVEEVVLAASATARPPGRKPPAPSRLPVDLRPLEVLSARPARPGSVPPLAVASTKGGAATEPRQLSETARAKLARVDEQLACHGRYLPPPKRNSNQ